MKSWIRVRQETIKNLLLRSRDDVMGTIVFNSVDALKNHILSCSKVATERAAEKVYYVIDKFLSQFYQEFAPEVYKRTYQLFMSLVKTDVKRTKNGWEATVYFDISKLNYSTRIVPDGKPWSSNNTFHRESWTDENTKWVFENAMTGIYTHGGYEGASENTAIWEESIAWLTKEKLEIFRQALVSAGIPIR